MWRRLQAHLDIYRKPLDFLEYCESCVGRIN